MKITLDLLIENLADSGLMTADEASTFCGDLTTLAGPTESATVVEELAGTGRLTPYQAECVCRGETSGLVFGDYVVLDKIGQGGMGVVLKAQHRRMNRMVAVKKLPAEALESEDAVKRFYREVEAAARLLHTNIVTAFDATEHDGTHFLIMEYVEGQDLATILKDRGPLPVEEAVGYVIEAARGLEYAHSEGIIHRDIKPGNILLDKKGTVKILDMGLARIAADAGAGDQPEQLTTSGQVMGTCDYMAPEQAEDTHAVDHRADVYSLGCTLYRLLTGEPLYAGTTLMAVLLAHRETEIPSLADKRADVPTSVDAAFQKMVAKIPEDRHASMTEVIEALQAALGRGSTPSVTPEPDSGLVDFLQQVRHEPTATSSGARGSRKVATKVTTTTKQKTAPAVEETIDHVSQADTDPNTVTQLSAPRTALRPRKSAGRRKQTQMLLLIGVGVGLAFIGAAVVGVILYVQTNYGTVVVTTDDKDIQVLVKRGGQVHVADAKNHWRVEVKSGKYSVELQGGNDQFVLDKDTITVARGDKVQVRVELKPRQVATGRGPPQRKKAPFGEVEAREYQEAWADYLGLPVERDFDLPGGEKLTMMLIPPGEFLMGSTEEERQWALEEAKAANDQYDIERIPTEIQHRVRISRPFYLGKYEVTQAEWEAVMGNNPSQFKDPMNPVEQVSWDDIQPFLAKLNTASVKDGMKFALPTEAQWEYACRAGTTTAYCFGEDTAVRGQYGWFKDNSGGKTHPVGERNPNGWGLYDMHGSVVEWCADRYAGDYYGQSPLDDPVGPEVGAGRVARGGSWDRPPWGCRSADRNVGEPFGRRSDLGFRLACEIPYTPDGKPVVPATASTSPPTEWQLPPDAPEPAIAPFNAVQAGERQDKWAEYLGVTVERDFDLPRGEKLTMVLIPPGEFLMGSTEEDQVQVYLTKPFYLGKYEVTQSEWKAVMSNNLSRFQDDRNPVEMVNWNDCTAFIAKLQVQLADPESGIEFALPTAAQWEYACRAGTQTRFYFGDDPRGTELVDYAWYEANSDHKAHAVGEKVPNAWGLYDMHGNVSEWCQDWSGVYQDGDPKDPSGPTSGRYRVRRGGGWSYSSKYCRSSHRYRKDPGQRTGDIGLRVALNLSKVEAYRSPQTTEVAPH